MLFDQMLLCDWISDMPEKQQEKPLPCPFCGGAVELEHKSGDYGYTYNTASIGCPACHICFKTDTEKWEPGRGTFSIKKQAEAELLAKWNTREGASTEASTSPLDILIDNDYSRENLIAICEAAVVPVEKWRNRDSPGAQEALGLCWVMLKAGCEFHVHPPQPEKRGCHTDARTIWLTIEWPTFNTFEYGGGNETNDTFYIPTPARLREAEGRDWY